MLQRFALILLFVAIALLPEQSPAITILSGPTFTPAGAKAPLAGTLALTTDVSSRITVQVYDGTNTWQRDFFDFGTTHTNKLAGFLPGRTNSITVIAHDPQRNTVTNASPLIFVTGLLPNGFPRRTVVKSDLTRMEPGYSLFLIHNATIGATNFMTIMDSSGNILWYSPSPSANSFDLRQLPDGNLMTETTSLVEIDLLGQIVRSYSPAPGYPINVHEGFPTDHGTLLYLSDVARSVPNFPSSIATNAPLVTTNVDDNPVVEISATNSAVFNTWSLVSLLDPTRISYLTFGAGTGFGVDAFHANAITEDTNDNSLIVSMRSQNAIAKFTRDGQLKWILGTPTNWAPAFQPYLLTPVGTPFEWSYGQHAPKLTPQGTILLFDDGNQRASPYDPPIADQANYSRAVEYSIDETNMLVYQVWNSTNADTNRIFSTAQGDVDWLPRTTNILVTYSDITYLNGQHPSAFAPSATAARIQEMTHDPVPQLVFDVYFFDVTNRSGFYGGYYIYRSDRIPDLYAHPVAAVADLAILQTNNVSTLRFSGDPFLSYTVQASSDFTNWDTLSAPTPDAAPGEFSYQDATANQYTSRFYRVLSQQSGP